MHPLDAFSLDGFEIVATTEIVVRRDQAQVWQILAVDGEQPDGGDHRIVERFEPGEHRCSMMRSESGHTICVRGFRRLLAHRELLEIEQWPGEDRLVRSSYVPMRWGRTHIATYAGVRPRGRTRVPERECSWPQSLHDREVRDLARLRRHRGD